MPPAKAHLHNVIHESNVLNSTLQSEPQVYLFDVEEVLGIKGDGSAGHRNVLIQSTTVADIGPHSKCHRFSL